MYIDFFEFLFQIIYAYITKFDKYYPEKWSISKFILRIIFPEFITVCL